MTPRERWLAVMRRQKPDRTPTDYWGTPETARMLRHHFGTPTLNKALDRMHVDYLITVGPRYVGPRLPPHTDVYGVHYRDVDYGSGKYSEADSHPLAQYTTVEQIEAHYRWPDPDWWDYSGIPARIRGKEDRAIRGGGSEPFLMYQKLRGDIQAMVDLVENPEIVEYCLGKMFDLAYTNTLRIYEAIPGKVDFTYVAEDMGTQTGLMFAPRHIRRFLFPGMKRMIDLVHSAGAYVFHHNDGNIIRILPELVGLGIDALNPIQWRAGASPSPWGIGASPSPRGTGASLQNQEAGKQFLSGFNPLAGQNQHKKNTPAIEGGGRGVGESDMHAPSVESGMDRAALKRQFGAQIIFHGAVDNQYTLPFGTVEEVRQEVRDNLRILGEGGGYILAPCHNIQPVTPVENIIAMYQTACEEG
jgi:uroporphyrinogen decarboxylase